MFKAGGECVISLFLETHVYFQGSVIYNPCVDRLTNIFYGVILIPQQTIRIIINSLPVIIEKDYNYNAVSTVSDEYFFFSLTQPKGKRIRSS